MTMTLAARATKLHSRLEVLDQTASNVAEANALEGLRLDLATRSEKLATEIAKQELLSTASIEIPTPAGLAAVRKRADALFKRFQIEKKAATLKHGQSWSSLLREVDTATGELATAVSSAWRGHRQSVFAGETPTQIRGKLALTKANEEALEVYKMKYSLLKAAFESFPEDIAAIEKVGKIAGELEKAAKAFDFNVPSEVKSFLEAVQSVKGAPLNLLTQTVQDWIEENGGSDSYSIRATGRE